MDPQKIENLESSEITPLKHENPTKKRFSRDEIKDLINTSYKSNQLDFELYKKNLLNSLKLRNKKESSCFDDIINNYQFLLKKNKTLEQKVELLDRDQSSLRRQSDLTSSVKLNNKDTESLQMKVIELEKELNDSIKENKVSSTKLYDIVTENMKLKDQLTQAIKQKEDQQNRINELDDVMAKMDHQIIQLKQDNERLKLENNKLENQNINLNNSLNKKISENNDLIDQILTIKNDYATKMNELMELIEDAKSKKQAADIYYSDKKETYKKEFSLGVDPNKMDDFMIVVEEVKIPNKLKSKLSSHNKVITSIKFNNFGSNMVSCSADSFIKYWDCSKSKYINVLNFKLNRL